jgi:lipopolysaccharide export system permease protein
MTTIVHRLLTRRLLLALAIFVVGIFIPVFIVSLFDHLPAAAFFSELFSPALAGVAPAILYVTLPAIVGLSITWTYGQLSSDGTLATLYNAGLSTHSVRIPALVLAALATVLGYVTSSYIAPIGAKQLHDVLNVIRRDLSPSLLEPNRLYTSNDGNYEFRFSDRLDSSRIGDVYFREITEENEQRTFYAREATFEREAKQTWFILLDGFVEVQKPGGRPHIAVFSQVARPSGLAGSELPARSWVGYFELGTLEFLRANAEAQKRPQDAKRWAIEAVKRFGIPSLSLAHTLLGLSLLMLIRWEHRQTRRIPELCCGAVFGLHVIIVAAAETAIFQDRNIAWLIGLLIGGELAVGAGLYVHANKVRSGPPVVGRLTQSRNRRGTGLSAQSSSN